MSHMWSLAKEIALGTAAVTVSMYGVYRGTLYVMDRLRPEWYKKQTLFILPLCLSFKLKGTQAETEPIKRISREGWLWLAITRV